MLMQYFHLMQEEVTPLDGWGILTIAEAEFSTSNWQAPRLARSEYRFSVGGLSDAHYSRDAGGVAQQVSAPTRCGAAEAVGWVGAEGVQPAVNGAQPMRYGLRP
jgi:hypothetical protein